MNRGGSIRKARKGEYAPCLVASDTSSGIHSEHQRRMAHFYTWSATMYELRSARRRSWWPLSGRGLLARFLYSIPVSTVGHRTYNTPPIPDGLEDTYRIFLHSLLSIPDMGEPRIIKLAPEAHAEAGRFFESLEPRLVDDLGDGDLEAWAGKLHGQIMRIAGIIHCCVYSGEAVKEPVSLATMQAAETIGLYFVEHAKTAFKIAGLAETPEVKDAKYLLKRLDGQTEITKRDLFHLCKGRMSRTEDMEVGLRVLVQRGYITVETIQTGGRPSEKIHVNPQYQKGQKLQKPN